jgi:uncharacterized protein (DUF433 family)
MQYPVFDESVGVGWDGCALVERVPGEVSGVPILKHFRLPADTIVGNFDAGFTAEAISDMFEMPIGTIQAVLDYAGNIGACMRILPDHDPPPPSRRRTPYRQTALPNARLIG